LPPSAESKAILTQEVPTTTQRNITILISSLQGGGAERVCCILANGLSGRGYEVTIITTKGPGLLVYPLAPSVRLVSMRVLPCTRWSPWDRLWTPVERLRILRNTCRDTRPDVLISFMVASNVPSVMASRVLGWMPWRLIVSEHTNPALFPPTRPGRLARRLTYPFADAVVTCGEGVASWFKSHLPRIEAVPIQNPVLLSDREPDPTADEVAQNMGGQNWILAMGRLGAEKRFDLLLLAFSRTASRQNWHLGIIGDGPLRPQLQQCIKSLGLEKHALLLGRLRNPYPVLKAGKVFALSSHYEGFPIALLEAMACGLPAVAFDCDYGPREIIRHEVDGLLVPPGDADALARALGRVTEDERFRLALAARASEVTERFTLKRFLDSWENLIERLTESRRRGSNRST
jgi:GalNAc-alpha-(1->4)-GalNAc-alpha-(1->3)-diNAcBac-PP-undecaprenol alpha-1,4-N-acetyl-D-galactosaminyltransferase